MLLALAPLVAEGLVEPTGIIVDAKSGVSGAGRGGGNTFGFAEMNEDVGAYGLFNHTHVPEMRRRPVAAQRHPGVVDIHAAPDPDDARHPGDVLRQGHDHQRAGLDAARTFYAGKPFVRVVDKPPHTKWALGSNLAFVSYAADPASRLVIALGAVDNLGKGAAGQAVQNANLMFGLEETAGLEGAPLWP